MMTRLYGLPSVRIPNLSPSRMSHPRATTSSQEWRFARLDSTLSYLTGPSGVRSRNNKEDLFWIRNRSRILVHNRIPDLGSEYGNQPYRGFHVQIVPPSCPGHRAQHQRVRHCASQHLVYSADDLRTVLRWRSRKGPPLYAPHNVSSATPMISALCCGGDPDGPPLYAPHNISSTAPMISALCCGGDPDGPPLYAPHNISSTAPMISALCCGGDPDGPPLYAPHNISSTAPMISALCCGGDPDGPPLYAPHNVSSATPMISALCCGGDPDGPPLYAHALLPDLRAFVGH